MNEIHSSKKFELFLEGYDYRGANEVWVYSHANLYTSLAEN